MTALAGVRRLQTDILILGSGGAGLFAAPSVVAQEIVRQHRVRAIGRVPQVRERYYAVTIERQVKHPVVATICETAQQILGCSDDVDSPKAAPARKTAGRPKPRAKSRPKGGRRELQGGAA